MNKLITTIFLALSLTFISYECVSKTTDPSPVLMEKANEISLVTFNTENLFDNLKDEGKGDWQYLPINHPEKAGCENSSAKYKQRCFEMDWTDQAVDIKLEQIAQMLRHIGHPDIMAFQEVENLNILTQLAKKMNYRNQILVEGPDKRGIDVGIIYDDAKLTYVGHTSHRVKGPLFETKPTRDILATFFRIKGLNTDHILAVYANHWPSQGATSPKRVATAEQAKKFIELDRERFQGKNKGTEFYVVSTGDFNTIQADHPHPFKDVFTNNFLTDARNVANFVPEDGKVQGKPQPLGTYFYPPKMNWDRLDRFFISDNLHNGKGLEIADRSHRVIQADFATHTYEYTNPKYPLFGSRITGVPIRSNHKATKTGSEAGYSDHMPVTIRLRY